MPCDMRRSLRLSGRWAWTWTCSSTMLYSIHYHFLGDNLNSPAWPSSCSGIIASTMSSPWCPSSSSLCKPRRIYIYQWSWRTWRLVSWTITFDNYLRKPHIFLLSLKTPSPSILNYDFSWRQASWNISTVTTMASTNLNLYIHWKEWLNPDSAQTLSPHLTVVDFKFSKAFHSSELLWKSSSTNNSCENDRSIIMYNLNIPSSLAVNPEMDPSTIPLPRLEALEITCQVTKKNQKNVREGESTLSRAGGLMRRKMRDRNKDSGHYSHQTFKYLHSSPGLRGQVGAAYY